LEGAGAGLEKARGKIEKASRKKVEVKSLREVKSFRGEKRVESEKIEKLKA